MKTAKKRLLSLMAAFMLVFTLAAFLPEGWLPKAKAGDIAFNYKDLNGAEWYCWNINGSFDDGYKTGDVKLLAVSGINLFTDVTIPSVVYDEGGNPHTVTALGFYGGIGKGLFEDKTNLETVTIPNTVTKIDQKVFNGCTGLTGVTIPNSVQEFGELVFEGCSNLKNINIPDGVEKISRRMFYACEKLEKIVIPDSVTFIDYEAFRNCAALGDITLSKNLKTISYGAFGECDALTDITIPASVEAINEHAFDTCHSLKKVFFPTGSGLKTIGDEAFAFCENLTSIRLPDTVTELGTSAFAGCTSLAADSQSDGFIIPKNVTKIGNGCFAKSGLFTVTIPKSLIGINKRAFDKCSNLRYVYIPEGVQWIGDSAFSNCENLTHIFIPKSVKNIYNSLEKKRPLTFENSPNVTVYGFKGTAAETVAKDVIITRPFVDMDGLFETKLSTAKYILSKSAATASTGDLVTLVLKVGNQTIGYKTDKLDSGTKYTVTVNTTTLPATQKASGIQITTSVAFGSTQFGTTNSIAKGSTLEGQTDMPELFSESLMNSIYKEIFLYEYKGKDGSFEITNNFRPVLADLNAADMTKVPAKEPTCTADGNIEYYKDSGDDDYGYVLNGTILNRMTMEELAIKATGHSFVDTVVAPTCTEKGYTLHKCSVCKYEFKDTYTDAVGHTLTLTVAKAPTCTAAGNSAYWTCSECGKFFKDGNGKTEIAKNSWVEDAKGHSFGAATYTWSADGKSCTASRKCTECGTTETEKATITSKVKTAATTAAMGVTTYTANFTNKAFTKQTKDVTDIPKLPDRIPGDINGDKEVNIKDVTLLKQYLAKWNVKINEANADVTGDGVINVKDLTLLKQYIAKWNVTLK